MWGQSWEVILLLEMNGDEFSGIFFSNLRIPHRMPLAEVETLLISLVDCSPFSQGTFTSIRPTLGLPALFSLACRSNACRTDQTGLIEGSLKEQLTRVSQALIQLV